MAKLAVGDPAPPFDLASSAGGRVRLEDLRGRKAILYFYPRDDTPGCTREACGFRDQHPALATAGVLVLGVSKDSLDAHARFRAKYDLPFALLSDPDHATARAYGAHGEKTMYGKKVTGTIRSTFLIDEAGRVAAAWSPVKVDGHAEAVLAAVSGAGPAKGSKGSKPGAASPAKAKAAGAAKPAKARAKAGDAAEPAKTKTGEAAKPAKAKVAARRSR